MDRFLVAYDSVHRLLATLDDRMLQNLRLLVELTLFGTILFLLLRRPSKPSNKDDLSEKEIDDLVSDWQPEPLVPPKPPARGYTTWPAAPVLRTAAGPRVEVEGREGSVVNWASANFLGLIGDKEVERRCVAALNKYGCGSCGPRGFYGTIDVHLELEARVAKWFGTPDSILYSYDVATASSVIPAFCKRGDILVVDEAASYALQAGCQLSRSRVYKFKHNDLVDLERVLQSVDAEDRRARRPLTRRFIVVEGVSHHRGDVCPLGGVKALKDKYRYRLLVDETYALGVLGEGGRGACEHFGLKPMSDVEIIVASLSASLGTVGGICIGDSVIVDHQRLSGIGYCFSASLPPFLAAGAVAALDRIEEEAAAPGGTLGSRCAARAKQLRARLASSPPTGLRLVHSGPVDDVSPLVVLEAAVGGGDGERYAFLEAVAAGCMDRGHMVVVSKVSPLDTYTGPPSLRLHVTAAHSEADVAAVADALVEEAARAAGGRREYGIL